MRSYAVIAISLGLTIGLAGCAHDYKSDWQSQVVVAKDNPRNGTYGTGPMRVEVVKYRCGLLYHQCTTVRFNNEVGNDDVFTYIGDEKPLSVSWKDTQTLDIKCSGCDPKAVKLRLPEMDYIHIIYET